MPSAKWALKAPKLLSLPVPTLALLAAGTVAWFIAGIALWEAVLIAAIVAMLAGWAGSWAAEAWLGASTVGVLDVQLGLMLALGVASPPVQRRRERQASRG